jgi:membrane protease YdiL (CAAX protease family)
VKTAKFHRFWLVVIALIIRFQYSIPMPKYLLVAVELALLVAFIYFNPSRLRELRIDFRQLGKDLLIGLIVGLVWTGLEMIWDAQNGMLVHEYYPRSLLFLPAVLLIAGWASALYEELLFRSAIMARLMLMMRPWMAIVAQGVLFGCAHWHRYFHGGQWYHAASTITFGIAMGLLAWRRGSISSSWLAHALNNSLPILFIPPDQVLERAVSGWLK